jgi:pyruvate-formate lyase-activating enzyme
VIEHLKAYVRWQVEWRRARAAGETLDAVLDGAPQLAPLSINLDLTTACNYACDHCVDMEILNLGVRHDPDVLLEALAVLAERGLRSVILIGGGEPTVYPRFVEVVKHLKALGLTVGLVTNGGRLDRVLAVADVLGRGDWVRLSLDSGTDATFQAMHRPRRAISLDDICAWVPQIKQANPAISVGFSFIVVWPGSTANDTAIHENLDEMVPAARRAKAYRFDYISFKPFLTRAETNNAEVVELLRRDEGLRTVTARIRANLDEAASLNDDTFAVIESTNLKVLQNGTYRNYSGQPHTCHMTYFRQVLSPLGVYLCPVYRSVPQARIGDKDAYATPAAMRDAVHNTLRLVESFDAAAECREVTCLYNHAHWFIEDLIEHPEKLDGLQPGPERSDVFL